jgi:alcohol dehydrogenase class IV
MDKMRESGRVIKSYRARRTMIICDKEMLRLGYTHQVINSLIAMQIEYVLFSDGGKPLEDELVDACLVCASRNNIDSVVAIGGEEVMALHQAFLKKSHTNYPSYEVEMMASF